MLAIQKKLTNTFYALLSLPATAVGFCFSTQVAALSWILSTKYNLHIEDVALVWLAGPLSGIIAQPIVGLMSDKSWFLGGRRKPFIIMGAMSASIMLLALPQLGFISTSTGISVVIVAIVVSSILDISINVSFNPARSIIADVTPAGIQRTKGFSWMQVVSGSFGIGAYFVSLVFGSIFLIYTAVVLVLLFSIIPVFFIEEPRDFEKENVIVEEKNGTSLYDGLSLLFPLYGFILFGLFVVVNKAVCSGKLDNVQTRFMYVCLAATIILGTITILKGKRQPSHANDFQKIMLANAFSWLGIQSMFVMSYFFIKDKMLPLLNPTTAWANSFSKYFVGAVQTVETTAGNILSLGFLLLNLIGAIMPVLVLEPLSKKIGKVKVYQAAIACMTIGYFLLYYSGTTEILFYTGMIICGIGWSAVISIVYAIMTEKVDPSKMGVYMGLFNLSIVLPSMMTPGISKLVNDAGDYSILFLVSTICLLISFFCWLFVRESKSKI
jgi:maltose/moltooligosaccharide transporter